MSTIRPALTTAMVMEAGLPVKDVPILRGVRSETTQQERALETWNWTGLQVNAPYAELGDEGGNRIFVTQATWTFKRVNWDYGGGVAITDFCGKRGEQSPSDWQFPPANLFQLMPALIWMDRTKAFYYPNNGCRNPLRIEGIGGGGSLAVAINDREGTYGDNSGSFDVQVEILERVAF